jgi:MFS transporter, DHA2 family, methylenomycin A resistance protein
MVAAVTARDPSGVDHVPEQPHAELAGQVAVAGSRGTQGVGAGVLAQRGDRRTRGEAGEGLEDAFDIRAGQPVVAVTALLPDGDQAVVEQDRQVIADGRGGDPGFLGQPPVALTLGLCAGYFLVLLDVTVVNVALPSIGAGLHAAGPGLAWVVDAYSVPLAALLLACGAIGDSLGHRRVVVAGFLGFGAASVLCALAPGATVLIIGRALQGVCAALMLPGTLALLTESAPDDRARSRAVGLWAAVGGAALPAGPFLGGLLAEAGGWRAVFWLNVPVIIAALIPVARQAPGTRDDQRLGGGVDWAGAAALVVTLGSAVTAVIQAAASPRLSIAMAAVTVLAGLAFWRIERATARPLLRVPVPARRPLAAASAVAGLMNLCSLGALFLLTQVFQDAHRLSPLAAGLLVLPAMLPLPLLGTTAGRPTGRIGPWRASALGLAVAAAGLAGVAASTASGVPRPASRQRA